jgi:hypothetical protein
MSVYQDNALVVEATGWPATTSNADVCIGVRSDALGFNGLIDYPTMYNQSLSPAQVQLIYINEGGTVIPDGSAGSPAAPLEIVSRRVVSDLFITVWWTVPQDVTVDTKYECEILLNGNKLTGSGGRSQVNIPRTTNVCSFSRLTPSTSYEIKLRGVNSVGYGNYTVIPSITTLELDPRPFSVFLLIGQSNSAGAALPYNV